MDIWRLKKCVHLLLVLREKNLWQKFVVIYGKLRFQVKRIRYCVRLNGLCCQLYNLLDLEPMNFMKFQDIFEK